MIELERALGLELSLTLIKEAPQVRTDCARRCREQRAPRVTFRWFTLKAGDGLTAGLLHPRRRRERRGTLPDGPPHDLPRRGYSESRRAVWPVRSCRTRRVEAMAADYLREIKARQPDGPYYLCGYSFGGLVAFEMARRLRESGSEIGLVGLFDTMPSPLRWPLSVWFDSVRRRMDQLAARAIAAPMRTWPAAAWKTAGRLCTRVRAHVTQTELNSAPLPSFLKSAPSSVLKVGVSALMAAARYRPGFYPGELTLFTPKERDPALPSLQVIWRRHARAVSVVDTAGSHLTMLSIPNAESAATSVTRYLPAPLTPAIY